MSPIGALNYTRWALLFAIIIVSFLLWRQPYYSKIQSSSGFIPRKLYEPEATRCNDGLADELQEALENPLAPSIPAFKESAIGLPSDVYDPYPEYNSRAWRKKWKGTHSACMGPRGVEVNGNTDDMVVAHRYQSKGVKQLGRVDANVADVDEFTDTASYSAPKPIIGSYNETGLESDFCFDRHARFDPYGYNDESDNGGKDKPSQVSKVEWDSVNWGKLQSDCYSRNEDRYDLYNRTDASKTFWLPSKADHEEVDKTLIFPSDDAENTKSYWQWQTRHRASKKRSAIVVRTWDGNEWTLDTMQYVRSYVMELALHSGAEYEIIILVEVKDLQKKIFEDPTAYKEALAASVPDEFADMTLLFNRHLLETWYPKVGLHDAKQSQTQHMHMPMELLSLLRPDIEFFWQMELDLRYTSHHYHFLETVSAWSAAQPRRLQWERASRYYVPAVHGSWANFSSMIANSTKGGGIWGAQRTKGIEPVGPEPPTASPEGDDYQWGVGEDADFVGLSPVFDVTDVNKNKFLFRYTKDRFPDGVDTPARATATVPMIRMSKRLLRAMHHSQITMGVHMFPEMYPESTTLHHGLKMVVFPLPVYMDYARSPSSIEQIFNADEGSTLLNAPYSYMAEWRRMTYWHTMDKKTTYPDELYKRWLGYSDHIAERLCLPGILLHPIKGV